MQTNQDTITLLLDRKILRIATDAFTHMFENYHIAGVIDHAAWIIQRGDLETMLSVLQPLLVTEQNILPIRLRQGVYNDFVRLIDYAGFAAPKRDDRIVLEQVYEAFSDSEDGNAQLYAVLVLELMHLSMLASVFSKMIHDPEAIDGSMYDLTEWDDFVDLVAKVKTLETCAQSPTLLMLSFGEWVTYSSYASHVYDLEDDITCDETAIMDQLNSDIAHVLRTYARGP